MKAKKSLSLKYLKECFYLDENCPSGLRWKHRPQHHFNTVKAWKIFQTSFAGKPAGCLAVDNKGQKYYRITISHKAYQAHRLTYSLFHNVVIPDEIQIDHEDGNGQNNLPNNLRLATHGSNSQNRNKPKNNTSGYKGVMWHKKNRIWFGRVGFKKKYHVTKFSHSKEEVVELVKQLREKLHNEFTNHGA
jgi:hypothetical protein